MGRLNYSNQVAPDVQPNELSEKISFMRGLSDWKFTNDPDLVEKRVGWYFQQCAKYGVRPTVAGLAVALNTSRQTMWQWQQRGDRLGGIIDQAKRVLNALLEDWGVNGKINPVALVWLQKNHFSYRDSTVLEVTNGVYPQQQARLSPAEIARQIEADIPIDDPDEIVTAEVIDNNV